MSVEVWAHGWELNGAYACFAHDASKSRAELATPIVQQQGTSFNDVFVGGGEVLGDLHHPPFVGIGGYTGYMDGSGFDLDEKKDIVGYEAKGC